MEILLTKSLDKKLLAPPTVMLTLDLHMATIEHPQEIENIVTFQPSVKGSLHGFCFWFDVIFEGNTEEETIILSTHPGKEETHWKQTIFLLPSPLPLLPENSEPISCHILMQSAEEDFRHYKVTLSIPASGFQDVEEEKHGEDCQCAPL